MTARGAPVVWLGNSRDTTYKSSAKYRCACGVEIRKHSTKCIGCKNVGKSKRWPRRGPR